MESKSWPIWIPPDNLLINGASRIKDNRGSDNPLEWITVLEKWTHFGGNICTDHHNIRTPPTGQRTIQWVHWTHGQIKWGSMWFWWGLKLEISLKTELCKFNYKHSSIVWIVYGKLLIKTDDSCTCFKIICHLTWFAGPRGKYVSCLNYRITKCLSFYLYYIHYVNCSIL